MSNISRNVGLVLALAMGVFSAYVFSQTGDWVAAVFCLGSVGYFLFFFSGRSGGGQ